MTDYEKIFKRKFAERYEDEVNVLKTQAIALPNRKAMFLLTFSKPGKANVKEGFVRTIMRTGSMKSWMDLMKEISENNPAEPLRLSHLGYSENYRMYLNKTHSTRAYFKKFFRNRFSKALTLEDHLAKVKIQKDLEQSFVYPTVFEGLDISKDYDKIEDEKWYKEENMTHIRGYQRKKPRVIM